MTATVVIGAGQAGLAVSRELSLAGVAHVVLERARVGQAWRDRWESFTLVTPNWTLDLPGAPYTGSEPEGHVRREEIVAYLEAYANSCAAPVREGVDVERLAAGTSSRFRLLTSAGEIAAGTVVVCTGAFQRPFRPNASGEFSPEILVLHSGDYRRPDDLPPGKILVLGSGQTGCQLTEELHLAGRDVFLACGKAPWLPRRLAGIDIFTWLARTPYFDQQLVALPSPGARLTANAQATGARGGHDLHYRTLQALGVPLLGRFAGVDGHRASFHDDLAASVAFGDARWTDICTLLTEQLPAHGYDVPELPVPASFACDAITELDLRDFGVVIMTSGFRPDYAWIDFPACDPSGFPVTDNGASPTVPGLYFCGVHWLRKRKSALLFGVGEDATAVARAVVAAIPRDGQ